LANLSGNGNGISWKFFPPPLLKPLLFSGFSESASSVSRTSASRSSETPGTCRRRYVRPIAATRRRLFGGVSGGVRRDSRSPTPPVGLVL
jgi:hypothetical protein